MAGPKTDSSGRIVKRQEDKPAEAKADAQPTVAQILSSNGFKNQLAMALPKHVPADRMVRVIITALRANPKLAECTQLSLFTCVLELAQLGLEPNTPLQLAYLIPRNRSVKNEATGRWDKVKECTRIVGYRGLIDLARRGGVNVRAYNVHDGDVFSYKLGLHPDLIHEPSEDPERIRRPITHSYAVATGKDFDPVFIVLTRAEIDLRRLRSSANTEDKDSPWVKDFPAMALKSAVRALEPWMPKQTEEQRALSSAIVNEDAQDRGVIAPAAIFDPNIQSALQQLGEDTSQIVDSEPEAEPAPEAKTLAENNAGAAPGTEQLPLDQKMGELAAAINGKQ